MRFVLVKTWDKLIEEYYFYNGYVYKQKTDRENDYDFAPGMEHLCGTGVEIDENGQVDEELGWWIIDEWMIERVINPEEDPEYFI